MVPNVSRALRGWVKPHKVTIRTITNVSYRPESIATQKTLKINLQPIPGQKLNRKVEGSRKWKWFILHIVHDSTVTLKIDDEVEIAGVAYTVIASDDWSESGYQSFTVVNKFQNLPQGVL